MNRVVSVYKAPPREGKKLYDESTIIREISTIKIDDKKMKENRISVEEEINYKKITENKNEKFITIARTEEEIDIAVRCLISRERFLVGLDTETTVNRAQKGDIKVSIITIYDGSHAVIFSLYNLRNIPTKLIKYLESHKVLKVGVDITQDAQRLKDSYNIELGGSIEIQYLTRSIGITQSSLSDLIIRYLPDMPEKKKGGHNGNWDSELSSEQIEYAVNDAKYSLYIYCKILNIDISKYNIENNKKSEENNDTADVYRFIELQLKRAVSNMKYSSLVNYMTNSYGPWRNKYTEIERKKMAAEYLTSYINTKKWYYEEDLQEFIVNKNALQNGQQNGTRITPIVDTKRERQFVLDELMGLAQDKAINKMCNSYGSFAHLTMKDRNLAAEKVINEMIANGSIVISGGKITYPRR